VPPEETIIPPVESLTPTPAVRAYVFPVQPAAAAEYEAFHHDYPATDIFCPVGSWFVAPTSGVVDFVRAEDRWQPETDDPAERGGIAVAIVGDDGVRYYGAHLSDVTPGLLPGVRVQAGQALGLTGQSGNARATPPHLHFGISHPTTPDDWQVRRGEISPYPYLQAWAAGTPTPPRLDQ
jgi:murein DD-endopeptidase MepM/ murein hydrolase activator NlpD